MSEWLIERYQPNHFKGWRFCTKRKGKRFVRYFSDRPKGRKKALRTARLYRDKLVAKLPRATKIKSRDIRNATGVIGVARVKEYTRSGRLFERYVASWPKR